MSDHHESIIQCGACNAVVPRDLLGEHLSEHYPDVPREQLEQAIDTALDVAHANGDGTYHASLTTTELSLEVARVLAEVAAERRRQHDKYGPEHDDQHTTHEWTRLIQHHVRDAWIASRSTRPCANDRYRQHLIRAAAIACAAIEAHDRAQEPA